MLNNLSFVLNNHFIIRHCNAQDGRDTPLRFHCHPGLRKWSRFFYPVNGEIDFTSHTGKQVSIKSGDILFLPYDIEYTSSWINSENGQYYSVEFILEYPDGRNLNLYEDLTYLFHDNGSFLPLFREIAQTTKTETVGFHLRCQEQFLHLLYQIAMHVKQNTPLQHDIQPALSVIEGNFREDIHIDTLASMCHMSPATFRRKFLKYASMPPIQYRNILRLTKARELIRTGLYTLNDTAEIVGISDPCYFSKLYKKHFGVTPSQDQKDIYLKKGLT